MRTWIFMPGLLRKNPMRARPYIIGSVFILTILASTGQAQQPEPGKTTKRQHEKGQEIPTLEFLEFLGEWETEDGRWIDPEELEQMSLPEPEQEKEVLPPLVQLVTVMVTCGCNRDFSPFNKLAQPAEAPVKPLKIPAGPVTVKARFRKPKRFLLKFRPA